MNDYIVNFLARIIVFVPNSINKIKNIRESDHLVRTERLMENDKRLDDVKYYIRTKL